MCPMDSRCYFLLPFSTLAVPVPEEATRGSAEILFYSGSAFSRMRRSLMVCGVRTVVQASMCICCSGTGQPGTPHEVEESMDTSCHTAPSDELASGSVLSANRSKLS
ncbi:uncharacterized protein LOC121590445 isoform X1 [Anopheles merus]|uniref:uncharacterized protein LOC121590445 isoform X1 n=1 Tax=Anopheles merus TaxID=30066 RepID=UPI001BE4A1B1|nr:uncharacterized protein LOC121590445 isoform X1 [Anopheles merus]